jgi:hypothetical protein
MMNIAFVRESSTNNYNNKKEENIKLDYTRERKGEVDPDIQQILYSCIFAQNID